MKILLTTTSFQDTPGKHHDLLNAQNWDIDYLRGPVEESILLPIIHEYDGVICGDDKYTREVIKAGKEGKLKVLSKYGVGLDRIDLEAAKEFDVKVSNVPGINQVSVSEHVLALLFTFSKNIHLQYNSVQRGSWKRGIGSEIQGKTLGVIGLGAVGKELAKKASALGMKVLAFDIYKDQDFLNKYSEINFTSNIDDIYSECDVISLHLPHTRETDKLINDIVITKKLKKQPIIINTARGKLIDPIAMISGIKNKQIKGYLCDVLETEPILENEVLLGLENVIITPHVGSRTYENVENQGKIAVSNLLNLLK
ncbi:phosphoglycerate dehydrogenase [Polaribacter sp.]|uniref:phosphoglycerate dehydrogenase n=1 Tax=Polaribacter sp. TaxID=1920175 RepID=UPI0025D78DCD|nr:phosphoglycerate dehydrogenase [Polaribacter sp.]